MKKLKNFIDNLADDKKSHVVLGEIINPIVMLVVIFILCNVNYTTHSIKPYLDIIASVIACVFVHTGIEVWQKCTGQGVSDFWDAAAGTYSALTKGLLLIIITFVY